MRALKSVLASTALLLALWHCAPAYAQLYAAPSCGAIRWDWRPATANPHNFSAQVHYKPAGAADSAYVQGPAIVHDSDDPGFRGVIPNLPPNTAYDIRLTLNSTPPEVARKEKITTVEWQFTPTFHSVGMCWAPSGKASTVTASVRFKAAGAPDTEYRDGLKLSYDARTNLLRNAEYRGSLVELQPNTPYDIELTLSSGLTRTIPNAVRTWNEDFPIASTITVQSRTQPLIIDTSHSGTASGYTLITGPDESNASVIDLEGTQTNNREDSCIIVRQGTHHVIIRGLKLQNCKRYGIYIERHDGSPLTVQTHDIVIEDSEILGWGGFGQDGSQWVNYANNDGGIHCHYREETADPLRPDRIIIQRNKIYNPRHSTNPWIDNGVEKHPNGPQPVNFVRCGTNHVIRYNDVYSELNKTTNKIHYFMDGFGGASNFSSRGFPSADSDIYGNRISQVYDDSIESEGANRNVRIWANYMDRTMVAIGNAHTSVGPLYVWRNVTNDMSRLYEPAASADSGIRGSFVKTSSGTNKTALNGGLQYFFHNTVLQPPPSGGAQNRFGAGMVLGDSKDETMPFHNFESRNNVWHAWRPASSGGRSILAVCVPGRHCEADHDIYNGSICLRDEPAGGTCENTGFGVAHAQPWHAAATPTYATSKGLYPAASAIPGDGNNWSGDFRLEAGTLGTSNADAVLIPNFNDLETTRNSGAQPASQAKMRFGRDAAGPVAVLNAAPLSGMAPLTVTFDATGSQPSGAPISAYTIDFGDGTSGSGATQTHTYTASGTFQAKLTVTDSLARASTANRTITVATQVGPTASLNATPLSGTAPLTVSFDATGSKPGAAPISSYSIDFGDGTSGPGATQSHVYKAQGSYQAVLMVTDTGGNKSTASRTIVVSDESQPVFSGASAFRLTVTAGPGLIINRAAGERIDFAIRASDGRALSKVRFFLQGTHRLTDTAAPFDFAWTPAPSDPAGNYVLVAEATDTAGNVAAESRNLTLLANTCSIFASSASVTQGQPIQVQGVCSTTQTVERVEFFVDDILQSPNRDVAPPYTWTMDTSAFALGTRVLRVRGVQGSTSLGEATASVQIAAAPLTLSFSPGPVVQRTEDLSVIATATDGRTLRQVDFYVNGEFRAGENIAPHILLWPASGGAARPDRFGRHQLYVQATDLDGNVLTATRDLYVLTGTCNVLLGTSQYGVGSHDTVLAGPHTVVQGQRLVVQGLCSASQSVQQIDFYVNGVQQNSDVVAPYGIAMNTASLAPGPHTVSITARLAGGAAVSHSIPIEVVAPRP